MASLTANCFRSQRYKTFESYSQQSQKSENQQVDCFRSQRYKTFESYSQLLRQRSWRKDTVSDRKDTKLLKAIHNYHVSRGGTRLLFQIAKIQNF